MARLQATRRQTKKGSKNLTDDDRATQIAGFQYSEVAKFQAARVKMTNEEKEEDIAGIRKQLGILTRKKKPDVKPPVVAEGPYEVDTTEESYMTEQAAAPTPEDTIEIANDNNNKEGYEEDNNTLHPRTARKQVCENNPEEESLFSEDGDNDHDDNDPNDDYSESTNDENKKKKSKRKTPTSTIRTSRKTHWSGRTSPAAQEAASVLVVIGANPNVAKFMVSDGLGEITKIQ